MRRFLTFWFVMTCTLIGVTVFTSVVFFHNVDLRHEPFVADLIVSALQAMFLTWATKKPGRSSITQIGQATLRHPMVAPGLVLDAALLLLCGVPAAVQEQPPGKPEGPENP